VPHDFSNQLHFPHVVEGLPGNFVERGRVLHAIKHVGKSRDQLERKASVVACLYERLQDFREVYVPEAGGTMREISTQCGFSDVHHFAKTFKRLSGQTPGSYRRTNQD
jgi:AraC-like DNA-binding protein